MTRPLPALLAAVLLTGCGAGPAGRPSTGSSRSAPPSGSDHRRLRELLARGSLTRAAGDFPAYAVTARVADVPVYDRAGGTVVRRLANPQPSGAPLTFLLRAERARWLEVYLPVRPNGSTGWVRSTDVRVSGVPYRVEVRRGAHELVVYDRDRVIGRYPVAIGTKDTPTPGGLFYLKELVRPTNPGGFYGPYAYGLSGFSTVLTSFAGGEGVIGLHGTNDESVIGTDVSHGCIRMRNADITRLAKLLPLGTPVDVLA